MADRNRNLRAVTAEDVPPKIPRATRKKTLAQAAAGGDEMEMLVALRDRVARTIQSPKCAPRDLAALSRRLQELGKAITELKAKAELEAFEDGEATPDEAWDSEAI